MRPTNNAGLRHLDATSNKAPELAARILKGDATAESQLVERYARPIRLILLKHTGNPQLASDLAQDTFIIAIKKLRAGEVRNPDALGAFLRQTAVNLSIEHFRREKRYVSQDDGIISLRAPHKDRKAERMDTQQARKMLDDVLDRLARPRDREILERFYLLEEDKSVICSALGLSDAHFDRVLYRARQRMRELLEDNVELRSLLFGGLFDG